MGMMAKASPATPALTASVYLILRYPDLKEALTKNMLLGGDNSARALPIGAILGAWHGTQAVPATWLDQMNQYRFVKKKLEDWEGALS